MVGADAVLGAVFEDLAEEFGLGFFTIFLWGGFGVSGVRVVA